MNQIKASVDFQQHEKMMNTSKRTTKTHNKITDHHQIQKEKQEHSLLNSKSDQLKLLTHKQMEHPTRNQNLQTNQNTQPSSPFSYEKTHNEQEDELAYSIFVIFFTSAIAISFAEKRHNDKMK